MSEEKIKNLEAELEQLKQAVQQAEDVKQQLELARLQKKQVETELAQMKAAKENAEEELHELQDGARPISVHVHRERKFETFNGCQPDFTEWKEGIVRHIATMPPEDGLSFVMDHLSGIAREEVTLRPAGQRKTPMAVISILQTTFREAVYKSAASLKREFYNRTQSPEESLMKYSLELMKAYRKACQADPKWMDDREDLLKGAFEVGVRDKNIQREIRRMSRERPIMTFTELRDEIMQWVGDDEMPTMKTATTKPISVEQNSPLPQSNSAAPTNHTLMQMLQNQQKQIDTLTQLVQSLHKSDTDTKTTQKGYKCRQCRTDDHMWYRCPRRGQKKSEDAQGEQKLNKNSPN